MYTSIYGCYILKSHEQEEMSEFCSIRRTLVSRLDREFFLAYSYAQDVPEDT